MNSAVRVFRLAHKELREILRDRRTIVTLVAMPLLLYPLMSVAFHQFFLAARITRQPAVDYRVGYLSNAEINVFMRRFQLGEDLWERARAKPDDNPGAEKRRAPVLVPVPSRSWDSADDRAMALEELKNDLREGKLDMIVEVPNAYGAKSDAAVAVIGALETLLVRFGPLNDPAVKDWVFPCKIYVMPKSGAGRAALAHVEEMFAAINEKNLTQRLNVHSKGPRINALPIERVFLEAADADRLVTLASLVPLILVLMTITGAVYPAIDLTAGERERGTLEILVAAPVPRFELLTAKYLSVFTVAVLTALVNLICMTLTVLLSGIGAMFGAEGFTPLLVIDLLGLLLLFAAFFSAVLLCLTSFARSFKEAQAYLIPLMLASLTPGVLAMLPGLVLDRFLAALPLVNIVLLARDLFEGTVDPVNTVIVISTTLMYALAALALAARVFGAESVLYSEQSNWADLLRRPAEPQLTATIPAALWCLAMMVPIHFGLIAVIRTLMPAPALMVVLSVLVTIVLFGLLPCFFMYLGHVRLVTGLSLFTPRPAALLAGLILGVSLWPMVLWFLSHSGLSALLEERFGAVMDSFKEARESLGWGVLVLGIVPAILEELFFRGLLYGAIQRRASQGVTITATALLFGLMHVVLDGGLGLERLIPTTLLGLVLSAMRSYSDSVWPSLILHVCHNTILLIFGLGEFGGSGAIPWTWLVGSAAGAIAGAALLLVAGIPKARVRA
jgi:ABC-2 type transport system permease protein/sodium transport system permease protein